MTLIDIVKKVRTLDPLLVIFARRPWTSNSEVRLAKLDAESRIPVEMKPDGFEYFLEMFVAVETLDVFGDRQVTDEQRASLLVYYADNDAFPSWVYSD